MSEIITDKLTGRATAGDVTITAGSYTMQLQKGMLLAYSTHGTDAVLDKSLNISSVTDNGTGSFTSTYTNNVDKAMQSYYSDCWGTSNQSFTNIRSHNTSSHRVNCYTHGGGADDRKSTSGVHGDLA